MSNSLLPTGLESTLTFLRSLLADRLATARVVAKHIPAAKVGDHLEYVDLNQIDGSAAKTHRLDLQLLEETFELTVRELRDAQHAVAKLKADTAIVAFCRREERLILDPPETTPRAGGGKGGLKQEDIISTITREALALVRDVDPKSIIVLVDNDAYGMLSQSMQPTHANSGITYLEGQKNLRIGVIVAVDGLSVREGVMFGTDTNTSAAAGTAGVLIDRAEGILPECAWDGWNADNLKFSIRSTLAIRVKNKKAFRKITV